MTKKKKSVLLLVTNAVSIAIYIVLSFLAIQVGSFKVTFEHLPVVLSGVLFGPASGMLVGGIGELINQLLTFGITPTTILWILPIVFRGLVVGLLAKMCKKQMSAQSILEKKIPLFFVAVCMVSGVGSSLLNTVALYVDSKLFGYYSYALVFGALLVRIVLSICTSIVIGVATKPVLYALKRARLI